MNEQAMAIYRESRKAGMSALYAYQYAVYTQKPLTHGFLARLGVMSQSSVSGTVDGFDVTVKLVEDDDQRGEDDVTGRFTDEKVPGAVRNRFRDWGSSYDYYVPSTYTLNGVYAEFRKSGMSKSMARQAVSVRIVSDMKDDADRRYYGVVVSVSLDGVELGQDSLWSIDVIDAAQGDDYLRQVADSQLIPTALDEAREAIPAELEKLRSTVARLEGFLAETGETTV
jgi:hypothetical protein